jgi:hypothetical protein
MKKFVIQMFALCLLIGGAIPLTAMEGTKVRLKATEKAKLQQFPNLIRIVEMLDNSLDISATLEGWSDFFLGFAAQKFSVLVEEYKLEELIKHDKIKAYCLFIDIHQYLYELHLALRFNAFDTLSDEQIKKDFKIRMESTILLKSGEAECRLPQKVACYFPFFRASGGFLEAGKVVEIQDHHYTQSSLDFFRLLLSSSYSRSLLSLVFSDNKAIEDHFEPDNYGDNLSSVTLKSIISSCYDERVNLLEVMSLAHFFDLRPMVFALYDIINESDEHSYIRFVEHVPLGYLFVLSKRLDTQFWELRKIADTLSFLKFLDVLLKEALKGYTMPLEAVFEKEPLGMLTEFMSRVGTAYYELKEAGKIEDDKVPQLSDVFWSLIDQILKKDAEQKAQKSS